MSKALRALEDIILYLNASEPKGLYCENIETIQQALQRLESIENVKPSEVLEAFGRITLHTEYDNESPYDELQFEDDCKLVDKALLKAEKEHKALEIIKKHFIIRMSEEAELNGNVWGRLVRIQSKEDEGTWDTTAIANIVDYKEDFDLLKEVLE